MQDVYLGAVYLHGTWTNVLRARTGADVKRALIDAGAEPHRVDSVVVTYWVEDRALVEELRDALLAQAQRSAAP